MQKNKSLLDKFVNQHFPGDFEFRENQEETILEVLNFYDKNPQGCFLLEAPTGSGKSIIAICVAGVLTYKKANGYILASDLALQSQYEEDINRRNLDWGSVKGVDNYRCDVNFEKHSVGDCKIRNLTSKQIKDLPCYETCGYFSNRNKAKDSRVSLLNYSYWLIQRNYVAPNMPDGADIPFTVRKFTICDEAHKLTEIVQNHFSPRITEKTRPKLEELRRFLEEEFNEKVTVSKDNLQKLIKEIYANDDPERLYDLISQFVGYLTMFLGKAITVKEIISKEYEGRELPRGLLKGFYLLDWVKDLHCKFEDYEEIVKMTNPNVIVKNNSRDSITFNCIDESYLMQKYFHNQANFTLLMTATMGAEEKFTKAIDANPENVMYKRLPSTFDFSQSPVYLYVKRRMSFREKEKTMPWIFQSTQKILRLHENQRGVIHTGSYEISERIYNSLPSDLRDRVMFYKNSEEKKEVLANFEKTDNSVLIGPSLLEGLDLRDDLSRFQIFAKVPFPSLADKYVSAKMAISQEWYDWKSTVAILQGIGRSVRGKNDWAITYFLDGCLGDVINRNRDSFPPEFLSRLRLIKT